MKVKLAGAALALSLSGCAGMPAAPAEPTVQVIPNEDARRVDVVVDGSPFTSYIWPTSLKKPTLHPIRTASGRTVTRGYPLDPRPGERADHPHHVGLWFNYGDVNGLDFWNNSNAVAADRAPKMGTILHREVVDTESGQGEGSLKVAMDWVDHQGRRLLREETEFVFHAEADGTRAIDRITTLQALDQPVSFTDNKEGALGLRVTRALEQPATGPVLLTDASGQPAADRVLDNTGVSGRYRSSAGLEGDDVWGTRGEWAMLSGLVEGQPVTVAILDHPRNVGYPTYWHARGYGLFAANPLGQKALSDGKEELNFRLGAGESVTFRHRILFLEGPTPPERIEAEYREWAR